MDDAQRQAHNRYANEWYHAHSDRVLVDQKRYREENAEEINARRAIYRAKHREKLRTAELSRRSGLSADERAADASRRKRQSVWFSANLRILRAAQGCADCGTSEGILHHHHIDPSTKRNDVAKMDRNSVEVFMDEVAKCVVLCASCHTKRHWAMKRDVA
jgi:hypothetical protein